MKKNHEDFSKNNEPLFKNHKKKKIMIIFQKSWTNFRKSRTTFWKILNIFKNSWNIFQKSGTKKLIHKQILYGMRIFFLKKNITKDRRQIGLVWCNLMLPWYSNRSKLIDLILSRFVLGIVQI
jgi:hypothetical protein